VHLPYGHVEVVGEGGVGRGDGSWGDALGGVADSCAGRGGSCSCSAETEEGQEGGQRLQWRLEGVLLLLLLDFLERDALDDGLGEEQRPVVGGLLPVHGGHGGGLGLFHDVLRDHFAVDDVPLDVGLTVGAGHHRNGRDHRCCHEQHFALKQFTTSIS